ncbi:MAG: trigger factor [Spirochaetaceae bacterium]|nr:trigger factor [Spirochaetaceae bacterium]
MNFTKEFTKLEKSNVRMVCTVKNEDVRAFYDKTLAEIAKDVQIKGFRKGKVPKNIIEQKFKDILEGEVLSKLIAQVVQEASSDETLAKEYKPLNLRDPELEGDKLTLDLSSDFTFSIVYDVFPSVEIDKHEGLEVEVSHKEKTEEDVNAEIEIIRERNAIAVEREESSPCEEGDIVTITYCEVDDDGKDILKTVRVGYTLKLGRMENNYQFDDEIVGMKLNEEKTFEKTYPAEMLDENLAGQTKKLKVRVKTIMQMKLPDLDDEFAQDVDEKYNGLDDLKNTIRKKLEDESKASLRKKKIEAIAEKIYESAPFEIPEPMVLQFMYNNINRRFPGYADELFKSFQETGEIVTGMMPDSKKSLAQQLILSKLLEKLNIEISEAEIDEKIEKEISSNNLTGKAAEEYEQKEVRDAIKNNCAYEKLCDELFAKNTITVKSDFS